MTLSLEDILERSRHPGEFTERRRFTMARRQAIEKMREFALADPHQYVLELIQAAMANGARAVGVDIRRQEMSLAYGGEPFDQEALTHLFDFLFVDQKREGVDAMRHLALGLNALLVFNPERITIESGTGTEGETIWAQIRRDDDKIEVGTLLRPLRGSFVLAEGLQREGKHLRGRGYPEVSIIQKHCRYIPVPLYLGNDIIYGRSAQRGPELVGFDTSVQIDEGDLYGSLGVLRPSISTVSPRLGLMTYGVSVEAMQRTPFHDRAQMRGEQLLYGGVINFDGLRKTVDQSKIVRDEKLEELWQRLEPYIEQMEQGLGASTERFTMLDGRELTTSELRRLLGSQNEVVIVDAAQLPDDPQLRAQLLEDARRLQEQESLQTLLLPEEGTQARGGLQQLVLALGDDVELMRLGPRAEQRQYLFQRPSLGPEKPWLQKPRELEPMAVRQVVEWVLAETTGWEPDQRAQLHRALGGIFTYPKHPLHERLQDFGAIRATIYSPANSRVNADALLVEIQLHGRTMWRGQMASNLQGLELFVDLQNSNPALLQMERLLPSLAYVMASHCRKELEEEAADALRLVAHAQIEPDSSSARRVLGALSGQAMIWPSDNPDRPFELLLLDDDLPEALLGLPILESLGGQTYSARQLGELMGRCGGLLYGVVPEVRPDLEGLNQDHILRLDLWQERQLMALLGPGAYVRVDARETQARHGPYQIRDVALGLRDYPGQQPALLLERGHQDASPLEPSEEKRLLELLWRRAHVREESQGQADAMEHQRQSLRHLQRFILLRWFGARDLPSHGIETLKLFLDSRGRPRDVRELQSAIEAHQGKLPMFGGRARDILRPDQAGPDPGAAHQASLQALAFDPWVFLLLREQLQAAFEPRLARDNPDSGAARELRFTYSLRLDELRGQIGLPATPCWPACEIIALEQPAGRVLELPLQPELRGLAGMLRLRQDHGLSPEELAGKLRMEVVRYYLDLLSKLQRKDSQDHENARAFTQLLNVAIEQCLLVQEPGGTVQLQIHSLLAEKILAEPVFVAKDGGLISAHRLLRELALWAPMPDVLERVGAARLSEETPEPLMSWVRRTIRPSLVQKQPSRSRRRQPTATNPYTAQMARKDDVLRCWLLDLSPFHGAPLQSMVISTRPEDAKRLDLDRRRPIQLSLRYIPPMLWLNLQDATLAWAYKHMERDVEAMSWLLLACYAFLNAELEAVTNEHERIFQLALWEAMRSGELQSTRSAGSHEDASR